jgi:MFS transporter, ACS family, hexuronate transporter
MRKADGSRRHPARAHPFCSPVLDCIDGHFTGRRVLQFRDIQISSGAGESANWPGATKAFSEWFPKRERALATALFDSGSSIGGAVAPFIVFAIYNHWGWRPAFAIPGMLGFVWLLIWRFAYYPPQDHPRLSHEERQMILADAADPDAFVEKPRSRWVDLLKIPQTWGVIIARSFTDPVWFFIADWFPIYLVAKGFPPKSGLIAWIPFIAADLGNFFGGAASGYLIKRGWTLGAARKLLVFGGFGVTLLIPTVLTVKLDPCCDSPGADDHSENPVGSICVYE